MASVFLSYSRTDKAKARALAQALEAFGHSVWWDNRLEGGSRFSEEIERALKSADVVLVMWSKASVESAWVQDEAAEGRDTKRLVPVVIDSSKPPLGFRQYQSIDLSRWKKQPTGDVIEAVNRAILAKAGPAQPPTHASTLTPPSYRRPALVAGSLLLIVAGALGYMTMIPGAGAKADALRLQIGEMKALTPDVPEGVPESLREELLTALATDSVITATTGAQQSGQKPGFRLDTSVRKAGDQLRFTVHVVNERTGATVWTETLERPADPLDLVPRQVAVATSQILRCGLGGAARYRKPLPDPTLSVYFNFCEEYWADTMGREMNYTRALDVARRLVAAAPDFSRGWSGLAKIATWAIREFGPEEAAKLRVEATAAAERAIELDRENSQAYDAMASLQPPFAFAKREKWHVESVSVLPGDCGCEFVSYGSFLARVGRSEEAAAALKRAHDMIPLSADVYVEWASALFTAGQPDEARDALSTLLELWPDNSKARETVVRSAFWTKAHDEALAALDEPVTPLTPAERSAIRASLVALRSGDSAGRSAAVAALARLEPRPLTAPLIIAALGALGEAEASLALAEAQIAADGPRALPPLFTPAAAPARQTARFARLVQKVGLVDYWRSSGKKPDFCEEKAPPALCSTL